jgi:hypothetical protein
MTQPSTCRRKVPAFLVVGTPRSGTTLLQRLACELPGVSVTPETHFFSVFYDAVLRGTPMPLTRSDLARVVSAYGDLPLTQGLDIDPEALVAALGGRCRSAWELFAALVCQLEPGARIVGEKTPNHLRWWRPLTDASPGLRLVAIVRDPRAVAASSLDVPFGMSSPMLIAAQWVEDLRDLAIATRVLGPTRLLRVRYEDVVRDPVHVKEQLATFLEVPQPDGDGDFREPPDRLFPSWESGWKARAVGPVDAKRKHAWRTRLSPDQIAKVELIAHRGMRELGYPLVRRRLSSVTAAVAPVELLRLAHFRLARRRQRRRILNTVVGRACA